MHEAARDGLRRRLDEVLGPEHATTLMAHLPRIDSLATRDDVRALGDRIAHLQELTEQRFEAFDQRFQLHQQAMDQRFEHQLEAMDLRFDQLLERMADRDRMVDQRFSEVHTEIRAARNEVIATARGDMVTQTRVMFFTMASDPPAAPFTSRSATHASLRAI